MFCHVLENSPDYFPRTLHWKCKTKNRMTSHTLVTPTPAIGQSNGTSSDSDWDRQFSVVATTTKTSDTFIASLDTGLHNLDEDTHFSTEDPDVPNVDISDNSTNYDAVQSRNDSSYVIYSNGTSSLQLEGTEGYERTDMSTSDVSAVNASHDVIIRIEAGAGVIVRQSDSDGTDGTEERYLIDGSIIAGGTRSDYVTNRNESASDKNAVATADVFDGEEIDFDTVTDFQSYRDEIGFVNSSQVDPFVANNCFYSVESFNTSLLIVFVVMVSLCASASNCLMV